VIPTVGRIVHYVARGSADGRFPKVCRAALVTEVAADESTVGLCAINPTGLFFHPLSDGGCAYESDAENGGTWHWPERAE
jgi:hypothetical protein